MKTLWHLSRRVGTATGEQYMGGGNEYKLEHMITHTATEHDRKPELQTLQRIRQFILTLHAVFVYKVLSMYAYDLL